MAKRDYNCMRSLATMRTPTPADSPTKTCAAPECDRPLRARGFCVTHYNRNILGATQRHPKRVVACVICQTQVARRQDSPYRPTCSSACRRIVQFGEHLAPVSSYDWATDARKRALDHGASVIEDFQREEIFDRDGWHCRLCSVQCTEPNPFVATAATVDHVTPLSLGGDHTRANAQTACLSCNSRKGAGDLVPV